MRQAIVTRYLAPTNHRGARIVVQAVAGRKVYNWNYELGVEENHTQAARQFAAHYHWDYAFKGGQLPNGDYAFVQIGAVS